MRKPADNNQLSLFGPNINVVPAVKMAMNRAARKSPLSREEICVRMTRVAEENGLRLSTGNARQLAPATLEKWLNPYADHVPGLRALVIFCKVVGCEAPLDALVAPLGLRVIDERQALLLERAEIEAQIDQLRRRKRKIEAEL